MIKAKIKKQSMRGNIDPYADIKRHISAPVLDHPDGSVTKDKLSKEVTDLLDKINGDSYTKEQVDELFRKLGATITIIGDGSDIKSKETQGIYTDGNSYLIVSGNFNAGAKYYFDKTGLYIQVMKDKRPSDWIPVQLSSDESLTTEAKTVIGAINELVLKSSLYVNSSQYTMDQKAQTEKIDKKLEETVLYEDVVNTPEWSNQPTYEGTLDSAFNTNDYYYVTLKDSNGSVLPSGQFMLKSDFDTTATVYPTVFSLADLNTGTGTSAQILIENHPVEFTEIGTSVKMRDAGLRSIGINTIKWNLDNGTGKLKITIHGELVQRNEIGYMYPEFRTSTTKKVASYNSSGTDNFQSASTSQIIPYVKMGVKYQDNHFYDDCILERNGNGYFSMKRNTFIKHSGNKALYNTCVGYGNILSVNTNVTYAGFAVNKIENGMLRNGTYIRVTEVK